MDNVTPARASGNASASERASGNASGSVSGNGAFSNENNNEPTNENSPFFHKTPLSPNFTFLTLIGPYVLIGFFVLMSLFNFNFKGIVYIFGLIILLFVSGFLMMPLQKSRPPICDGFFGTPSLFTQNLPFGVLVYTYTFVYLLLPMIKTSTINYPLLMSLMLILAVDIVIQMNHLKCVNIQHICTAIIASVIVGLIWSSFMLYSYADLVYHTDFTSDKAVCSMPSQQKFKCKVYKNGELITTMSK